MGEREQDKDFVDREEAAAAAEAAGIGGYVDYDGDPAERALTEGGEGEAEGFELAEEELMEHASHDHQAPDPTYLAAVPEEESDRSTSVDADADDIRTTERRGDT